jgi:hypothetical protein
MDLLAGYAAVLRETTHGFRSIDWTKSFSADSMFLFASSKEPA